MSSLERAADALVAARATWAVASAEPMPDYASYMRWYRAHRRTVSRSNPDGPSLARALAELSLASRSRAGEPLDALPWIDNAAPPLRRTYAALVSFVDDYDGPFPRELFPPAVVARLRTSLVARSALAGVAAPLTLDEQLAIALEHTDGRVFAAAVALHAATRSIARGRDTRALGTDDHPAWTARVDEAAALAPFDARVEDGGDAPGDTYHYWATFVAGFQCAVRDLVVSRVMDAMFWTGPVAMRWIRGGLFANELFAGAHHDVDRLGLSHGRAIGRLLRSVRSSG